MCQICIGSIGRLCWNTAKRLGDEFASGDEVRVEAYGVDWIVVRDTSSEKALFASFTHPKEKDRFWETLVDNDRDEE